MPAPDGFAYDERRDGSVVITHRGRTATVVRGTRAAQFLAEVGGADSPAEPEAAGAQEVMARWTGNYRRGNERTAKRHPRNATRRQ